MSLLARDIMNREVVKVSTTMDLRDLARLFLDKGISGAPVVDEQGDLAGVISQTDLIYYNLSRDDELKSDSLFYQAARVEGHHIPSGFQIEDCNTGCVADVMTPMVHSVTERASVDSVARMMTRKHIHRVIVRRGRKVTGVISVLDVLETRARKAPTAARKTKRAKTVRPGGRASKAASSSGRRSKARR